MRKPFGEFSLCCESKLWSCRTALSVTLIISKNTTWAYPSQKWQGRRAAPSPRSKIESRMPNIETKPNKHQSSHIVILNEAENLGLNGNAPPELGQRGFASLQQTDALCESD